MKNILCFGDSNTYGLKPDNSGRYAFNERYPGRLQELLGNSYHVIEEGCPGRTTVFEDKNRPGKKGIDYILPCIESHKPLDYIVIMLGTNDSKFAYSATSEDIAAGLVKIIDIIKNNLMPRPRILIVSPILLGEDIYKPEFDDEFNETSIEVVKGLAREYKKIARGEGLDFLDASSVASPSPIDREHLDKEGHNNLAVSIADIILRHFSESKPNFNRNEEFANQYEAYCF